MPYFVGRVLELPLTTIQDYGLFDVLRENSIDRWKQQVETLYDRHGLISFIVHPDYITRQRERGLYRELLEYISRLREERDVWVAVPGDINLWWRERSQMGLVWEGERWQVRGQHHGDAPEVLSGESGSIPSPPLQVKQGRSVHWLGPSSLRRLDTYTRALGLGTIPQP